MDSILWDLLQYATKLHIPRVEEGLGVECVVSSKLLVLSVWREGASSAGWFISQSSKVD